MIFRFVLMFLFTLVSSGTSRAEFDPSQDDPYQYLGIPYRENFTDEEIAIQFYLKMESIRNQVESQKTLLDDFIDAYSMISTRVKRDEYARSFSSSQKSAFRKQKSEWTFTGFFKAFNPYLRRVIDPNVFSSNHSVLISGEEFQIFQQKPNGKMESLVTALGGTDLNGEPFRSIPRKHPVQTIWKNISFQAKVKFLKSIVGYQRSLVFLAAIYGEVFPTSAEKIDEIESILNRVFPDKAAYANFLNITIQSVGELEHFRDLESEELVAIFGPGKENALTLELRHSVSFVLVDLLARRSDYFAGKTLLDLSIGLGTSSYLSAYTRFRVYEVLKERWPGLLGGVGKELTIGVRRILYPANLAWRITCGDLAGPYSWKRLPW